MLTPISSRSINSIVHSQHTVILVWLVHSQHISILEQYGSCQGILEHSIGTKVSCGQFDHSLPCLVNILPPVFLHICISGYRVLIPPVLTVPTKRRPVIVPLQLKLSPASNLNSEFRVFPTLCLHQKSSLLSS